MASYLVHMMGQQHPIAIDLPLSDIEEFMAEASSARFLVGHFTTAAEDGAYRRVMISTYRIECVVEID